jgi:hypothetical protein
MDEEWGSRMHHRGYGGCWGWGMHGDGHYYKRRFFTKAEKVEMLKSYAEELKKELKAVEEKIKEMQSQK